MTTVVRKATEADLSKYLVLSKAFHMASAINIRASGREITS